MIAGIGKMLVLAGLALVGLGLVLILAGHSETLRALWARFPPGRLPGDLSLRGEGFSVHFPWVTCLLVSLLASLVLSFWRK